MKKNLLCTLLCLCLAAQMLPIAALADVAPELDIPAEDVAQVTQADPQGHSEGQATLLSVGAVQAPQGYTVVSQTDYPLVKGVTETQLFLNDGSGTTSAQVAGYMTTVEPGAQVAFKASYPDYYRKGDAAERKNYADSGVKWKLEKTTAQAQAYRAATGDNVIFATNGDYFNMQTGQPLGYLIMEGNVIQAKDEPYFAVLKDGSYAIRDPWTPHDDVQEAVSGPLYLVHNGEVPVELFENYDIDVRNAIGLKPDGTVILFLADGRQAPYSRGMRLCEAGQFLLAQGCTDAIYLDGGGSATYVSKREGEADSDLQIRNRPSDGSERIVSSALVLVTTGDPGNTDFDHAALSPNNLLYTPGSTVAFSARGVTETGRPAELPAVGLSWAVTPAEAGSIDQSGVFTGAAGYVGEVTAQLLYNSTVVGETTVSMVEPAALSFMTDAISLDFNTSSDLGFVVKNDRDVDILFQDGDFTWTVAPQAIGSMTGNTFRSADGQATLNGTVTVGYTLQDGTHLSASIAVEVGKMPVVVVDMEPDENGQPRKAAHYHWGKPDYVNSGENPNGGWMGPSPLTVSTAHSYTDHGTAVESTLAAPYVFSANWDGAVPAGELFRKSGYYFYLWPNATLTKYLAGDLKFVDSTQGEVRFGDYAMELDYEYESYDGSKNANFYIRYCGEPITIEGYPTEVGVWIYTPENTPPYQLAMDLSYYREDRDDYGTINCTYLTYTRPDGTESSVFRDPGWHYWSYPLTQEKVLQYQREDHPLKIIPGSGLFWLSYQPGNEKSWENYGFEGNGRKNGTLYFDNVRFVYGTNVDDLVNPQITSVTANGRELTDGMTLDSNAVELYAYYSDPESANRTGMDAQSTTLLVDGESVDVDASEERTRGQLSLCDGPHTITVRAYDNFGNADTKTLSFTVSGGSAETAQTSVWLEGSDLVPLGAKYQLKVMTNAPVGEFSVTLANLNSDFGIPTVEGAQGVEVSSQVAETGYKKSVLTVSGNAADAIVSGETELATITWDIDEGMDPDVDIFSYTASSITFTDQNGVAGSASHSAKRYYLSAYYVVVPGIQVEGKSCAITVTDQSGASVGAGVSVYVDSVAVGVTNANGQVTTSAMSTLSAGAICPVSAKGPDGLSFTVNVPVLGLAPQQSVIGVHLNGVTDGATMANVSWMSNADSANKLRYYVTSAGVESAVEVRAAAQALGFNTSKNSAYSFSVTLEGLAPATNYTYQLWNGAEWEAPRAFATVAARGEGATRFFLVGDTQMSGVAENDGEYLTILNDIFSAINTKLEGAKVDFGIQTGDYVDNGGNYAMWEEIFEAFDSGVPSLPMLHVMGNHEYYGDGDGGSTVDPGVNGETLMALPDEDYYSVEYGDVYIAVINNSANLTEAAQWLIEDAPKSECTWKIMTVHEPPYYTNGLAPSTRFHDALAPACDEAGIQVVFSGHNHSYARTFPMKGDQIVEDDEGGTYYFICGDLGEKSRNTEYAPTSEYVDRHIFANLTQEYDGLFVDVQANEDEMIVTAWDSSIVGTDFGEFVDRVVIKSPCASGHDLSIYDRANDTLTCGRCRRAFDAKESDYTGLATEKGTENKLYFMNGVYQTGWIFVGDQTWHATDTGIAHETKFENTTTCTAHGYPTYTCLVDGQVYQGNRLNPTGHDWDDQHICRTCGFHGIDIASLDISLNAYAWPWNGNARRPILTIKDGEKVLERALSIGSGIGEYYATYPAAEMCEVGTTRIELEGMLDYYGTTSIEFDIVPPKAEGLKASAITTTSVTLTWDETHGATRYVITDASTGKSYDAATTSITLSDLAANSAHRFQIRAYADLNSKTYRGFNASDVLEVNLGTGGSTSRPAGGGSSGGGGSSTLPVAVKHTVTSSEISAAIQNSGDVGVAILAPTDTQGAGSVSVELSQSAAAQVADAGLALKVETPIAHVTLPSQVLASIDKTLVVTAAAVTGKEQVTIDVTVGGVSQKSLPGGMQVELSGLGSGDVVMAVDENGQRRVVQKSLVAADGSAKAILPGACTVEIAHNAKIFTDVPESHWAKTSVDFASSHALFNGTSDTTFDPSATMTRAMVVTVLHRLENTPVGGQVTFPDVSVDLWYSDAVAWAANNQIVEGDGTGFHPEEPITREQMAAILYRYAQKVGLDTSKRGDASRFPDSVRISPWASDAMSWAVGTGLLQGRTDGQLDPTGNTNRAEIATVLQRMVTMMVG